MPARVVRLSHRDRCATALVDIDGSRDGRHWIDRWHVILRPQLDFNGRRVGYRVWLRRDELPATEDDALAAACGLIELITAAMDPPARALPDPATPGQQ